MTVWESPVEILEHSDDEHRQIVELQSAGTQLYKQSENIASFCL